MPHHVAVFGDRDNGTRYICASGLCGTLKPIFDENVALAGFSGESCKVMHDDRPVEVSENMEQPSHPEPNTLQTGTAQRHTR